jgi:hypothetical protein
MTKKNDKGKGKRPERGRGPSFPLAGADEEEIVEAPAQVPVDAGNPGDFDPALERYLSGLQQQGDVARVQRDEQLGTLKNEYFNPSDPFSRQALLEKSLGDSMRENLYSSASRGQLYSGNLEEQNMATQFAGQQDYDTMLDDYADQAGGIERDYTNRLGTLGQDAEGAIFDRTNQVGHDVMQSDATTPAVSRGPAPAGGKSVAELKKIRKQAKGSGNNKRIAAVNAKIDDVRAYKQTPHPSTQMASPVGPTGPRPHDPKKKKKNR